MLLLLFLLWAKTMFAYGFAFELGLDDPLQYFILVINPIATTMLILSIGLFVRRKLASYITMTVLYILLSILLFSNVTYYAEFTDFISVNTILGVGKVFSGLGDTATKMMEPSYLIYLIDLFVLPILLWRKKIQMQEAPVKFRFASAMSILAVVIFSGNLFIAEVDRPQLLSRTFSNNYMVKYLGINGFTIYDGIQTYKTDKVRAQADSNDLEEVQSYVDEHYAAPNDDTFGIAEGRNVIYIHLESFQQFLLDYQLTDSEGVEHEVTPFLNSLFHDQQTFAFDNFFHQVKAGKTSDAENLIENSLFGLNQGSLFAQMGATNTFEAAPNILKQTQGYTSATFHSNVGNFWNRTETYKSLGYDYFFDQSYYDMAEEDTFQYGMLDKPFFEQSIQYLEHLQQPFYTKFLTVANHFPYSQLDGTEDDGFPEPDTGDATIDDYFKTANYLDSAVEEFFNYLKASGLYDNSVIVLYGDHYGISNSRNTSLASLVGKTSEEWSNYDNAQMQRVPFMVHVPGQDQGGINHTYGGEVDALPTLLHLLGVDTTNYMQVGQDLLSDQHEDLVAFRDGDFMTPDYTYYGGKLYANADGQEVVEPDEKLSAQVDTWKQEVAAQLSTSDAINVGNLLRFDSESGLAPIDTTTIDYRNGLEQMTAIEEELGDKSTSLYSQNNNQTTTDLYETKSYQEMNGSSESSEE
ncbi:MAG: LTA synthase family protein [Enterococcus sp.]